jgi:PAS domain S-box-containing protein/putative nucleotidyltransferase with HDIG domain
VSPAIKTITGYTPEECYANPNLFFDMVLPEDRTLLKDAALADEENRPFVLRWVCKDGKVIWAERHNVLIRDEFGIVLVLEGSARDVTERIQRQLELEAIASVSAALRTAPNLGSLIEAILGQVNQLLQADGSSMSLKEPNSDDLMCVIANGRLSHTRGLGTPAGQGITGYAMQTGQLYVTQDYVNDPHASRVSVVGNFQAMACAPLITQGQAIGVLTIARRRGIDEQEGRLLTVIANIAANAIQRTTLHEASQRNARQMAAVSEVGRVLSEKLEVPVIFARLDHYLYELLPGISAIFISAYDAVNREFICQYASLEGEVLDVSSFPPAPLELPGVGTQSEVVHTRRPQIINDLQVRLTRVRGSVKLVGSSGPLPQSGLYAPMLGRDQVVGVIQVQASDVNHFTAGDAEVISLVANTAAVAIENARLLEDLQHSNLELLQAYDATLEGWSRALDLRDRETEGHTKRVAQAAVELAQVLGLSGEDLANFQRGALLHDIGKMGIPDSILLKPGPLTPDEMEIMRRHPQYAYDLLHPTEYLRPALEIPYCHHEKWDGMGYPRRLKGEEIPLGARIFAVIDVWDALTSDRPYRLAWSEADALAYIRAQSGLHFDPDIVEAFFKMMGKN